jgi:hypothetical protein
MAFFKPIGKLRSELNQPTPNMSSICKERGDAGMCSPGLDIFGAGKNSAAIVDKLVKAACCTV